MNKPSDLLCHPYDSVFRKIEHEIIARSIMVILYRTGNKFRLLSWDEYVEQRLTDGNFSHVEKEKKYFDLVVDYCSSLEKAKKFSPAWNK